MQRRSEESTQVKVAIASGKGGTGKTTIATNLARTIARTGKTVHLLDCDVEEPNCHIFLHPIIDSSAPVSVSHPDITAGKCTKCGICGDVCEYSAIIVVKNAVLTFPELCHGCGACSLFCPENAIIETPRSVGIIEKGKRNGISFTHGLLNIGELMSPAIIQTVRKTAEASDVVILDSPPGTSCPVIETVRDADIVLLVTEPTPFGLNDLELAVGMARALDLPFAVAINRCDVGNEDVKNYCSEEKIDVIMEIPDDRKIAEAYSRGDMIVDALPGYMPLFEECLRRITRLHENTRTNALSARTGAENA